MDVIAFTGLKRSGKDSAASIIIRNNPDYLPVSFAHPLKQMCERCWNGYGISEEERENDRVFRLQLRDIVKGMVSVGFDYDRSFDYIERVKHVFSPYTIDIDERFIEISCSYRQILQLVGTDVCRHFNDNIWIEKAEEKINELLGWGKSVIITDLRFDNEAEMLKNNYNTFIVEVRRSSCYNNTRTSEHKSEKGIASKHIDFVIDNNGTLEDYERKLINLIGG